jgi:3',5'-nucleoside bisphosphate phosphatase
MSIKEFRADLHCHTTCSDGSYSPQEIVKLAVETGLSGLSITDHDSIEAYQTAVPIAKELNLPLISGIEFSSMHKNVSVHVLAYSFSLSSPLIHSFCAKHHQRRLNRNQAILELLDKQGMPVSEEDLYSTTKSSLPHQRQTLGRPHIALALVQKGYVESVQEAFQKYIGEGKSCYVPGSHFTVEETIQLIHQANGFAIIAHPHLIEPTSIVRDLLEMNFDGLEGYYARFHASEQKRWVKIGQHRGWIVTGGSDFHGDIKPTLPLGSSWVRQEIFQILLERFQYNSQT